MFQLMCNAHITNLLMCNLCYHRFTIIIYDLHVPQLTTFQTFIFFLLFLLKKHTTISADINLLMIHIVILDKFFGMVYVIRQLIRIRKDIPN
jgi:hypothetical protein